MFDWTNRRKDLLGSSEKTPEAMKDFLAGHSSGEKELAAAA